MSHDVLNVDKLDLRIVQHCKSGPGSITSMMRCPLTPPRARLGHVGEAARMPRLPAAGGFSPP
jgi:hypothetical protein